MPLVSDTLIDRLRQQLKQHCVLVWYDPQQDYADLAGALQSDQLLDAHIAHYRPERGFVGLRHDLEPLWGAAVDPPRLLIYVPLARGETAHALVEYEVAGAVLQPGQQPPEQDTALPTIARLALADVLPPAALARVLDEVQAGKWTLAELDQEAERGIEERAGVLKLIFGSGSVTDIVLGFLTNPDIDDALRAKDALPALLRFFTDALGMAFDANKGTQALRVRLARQLLMTELAEALDSDLPAALATFPLADSRAARQAAAQITRTWRNRRDLVASYVHWVGQVETDMDLRGQSLALEPLSRLAGFAAFEQQLQLAVEKALLARPSRKLLALIDERLRGFWSDHEPEIKVHWQIIRDAGLLLLEANRIEQALKGQSWTAGQLFANYALGETPWCQLDTYQRHLERDYRHFDIDLQAHDSLVKLAVQARQRHAQISNDLAKRFVRAYADAHFDLPGVLQQADVYRDLVAPEVGQHRIAYILVDGLRFEMAREFATIIGESWSHELTAALATVPTITEIGMAALLPGAEQGVSIEPASSGHLAAVIDGVALRIRGDRVKFFQSKAGKKSAVVKLSDLAPPSDRTLADHLRAAEIIMVTASDEIDGLWENDPGLARRTMDDALNQLRRGVQTLFREGVQTVVISADHGFLFGQGLESGERIDSPGGQTATLKRRVWIGQGGDRQDGVVRRPLAAFGVSSDLELVTPFNLSCFKVPGGSNEYFHGGLSLPELVIPALRIRSGKQSAPPEHLPIEWGLTLGSKSISTRFLSVKVEGVAAGLLPIEAPAVRVEVRAGTQAISVPVSATYGFQESTQDIQLGARADAPQEVEANTVTLMLTETPDVNQVDVYLLDAATGRSLAQLTGISLSIAL